MTWWSGWHIARLPISICTSRLSASPAPSRMPARVLMFTILLAFTTVLGGCVTSGSLSYKSSPGSTVTSQTRIPDVTPTNASTINPRGRIRNVTPNALPLFATIHFTAATTYEQAVAIIGGDPYPWWCDEPRSNIPPPISERQHSFATTHWLLISYPVWDQLTRIASSPNVTLVEGTVLYPCP